MIAFEKTDAFKNCNSYLLYCSKYACSYFFVTFLSFVWCKHLKKTVRKWKMFVCCLLTFSCMMILLYAQCHLCFAVMSGLSLSWVGIGPGFTISKISSSASGSGGLRGGVSICILPSKEACFITLPAFIDIGHTQKKLDKSGELLWHAVSFSSEHKKIGNKPKCGCHLLASMCRLLFNY